jgi:hypothetical protein
MFLTFEFAPTYSLFIKRNKQEISVDKCHSRLMKRILYASNWISCHFSHLRLGLYHFELSVQVAALDVGKEFICIVLNG